MLGKQSDPARSKDRIHPQAVARAVSDLAARDAVFVIDTGLNTLWSGNWIRQRGEQRIIGSFNNGAVGTALGQANGIQALDRSRQVIALCGDGGFNMLLSEFLTAVHHKLPVKAVVYNNSSLGLIKLEAESMGLPAWKAMDFPNPDYVTLARACGAVGFKAEKPGELARCHKCGAQSRGPGHHRLRGCGRRIAQRAASRARDNGQFRKSKDQGSDTQCYRRVTEFATAALTRGRQSPADAHLGISSRSRSKNVRTSAFALNLPEAVGRLSAQSCPSDDSPHGPLMALSRLPCLPDVSRVREYQASQFIH